MCQYFLSTTLVVPSFGKGDVPEIHLLVGELVLGRIVSSEIPLYVSSFHVYSL